LSCIKRCIERRKKRKEHTGVIAGNGKTKKKTGGALGDLADLEKKDRDIRQSVERKKGRNAD